MVSLQRILCQRMIIAEKERIVLCNDQIGQIHAPVSIEWTEHSKPTVNVFFEKSFFY